MKTLYEINSTQLALINQIEELEGEITSDVSELLTINEKDLKVKSIAYLEVIKTRESMNMMIDAEIKRLMSAKKANDNLIERLKSNLLNAVNIFGEFQVGFQKFSKRISERVNVEDVNLLPKEFKTVKITETPDKIALKDAIKRGEKIEGVSIVEMSNLKIN